MKMIFVYPTTPRRNMIPSLIRLIDGLYCLRNKDHEHCIRIGIKEK